MYLARLQREGQATKGPEQVGADQRQLWSPEGEDHQRDRDPAGARSYAIVPEWGVRQAEEGTSHARQGATKHGVNVAIRRHVDVYGIGGRRRFSVRPQVEAGRGW